MIPNHWERAAEFIYSIELNGPIIDARLSRLSTGIKTRRHEIVVPFQSRIFPSNDRGGLGVFGAGVNCDTERSALNGRFRVCSLIFRVYLIQQHN